MPYRRLPNTDNARYKALKTAYTQGISIAPFKLAFTQSAWIKVKAFFPAFELALNKYKEAYNIQVKRSKEYNELLKKSKLYISHFIQVMNFGIMRGELPAASRTFYGIGEKDSRVPLLNTEAEVIAWGERVIKGDSERVGKGGNYITNPTCALVKVWYEKFKDSYYKQKTLQETSSNALAKVTAMRVEADQIILEVWNEVENFYKDIPDAEKREKCGEYGLSYVWRPSERLKILSATDQELTVDEIMADSTIAEDRTVILQGEDNMVSRLENEQNQEISAGFNFVTLQNQ